MEHNGDEEPHGYLFQESAQYTNTNLSKIKILHIPSSNVAGVGNQS